MVIAWANVDVSRKRDIHFITKHIPKESVQANRRKKIHKIKAKQSSAQHSESPKSNKEIAICSAAQRLGLMRKLPT